MSDERTEQPDELSVEWLEQRAAAHTAVFQAHFRLALRYEQHARYARRLRDEERRQERVTGAQWDAQGLVTT